MGRASSARFRDSSACSELSRRASDYLLANFGFRPAIQRLSGTACEVPAWGRVNYCIRRKLQDPGLPLQVQHYVVGNGRVGL